MSHFSGKQLKQLRTEAGFTQKQLSELIGVSRETVVAIENEYPGSINKLGLELVNTWWSVCRKGASADTRKSFKQHVVSFFNLSRL